MSDEKAPDLSKLKATYGSLITLTIEGKVLAFKRLTKSQLTDLRTQLSKKSNLVIDLTINVCGFNCVYGSEYFEELSSKYPLAFCGNEGNPGVIDALMDLARGGAEGPTIQVI